MIVRRFYDRPLAQASYLIGCGRAGTAIVIDPIRGTEQYLRAAQEEGLRIAHVTETHIHADFVSGARDLAKQAGATLHLSDEGDADWKYAFAAEDNARLLHDGDTIRVGDVVITAVHTPGHTPEHLSFLVTDTAAATDPVAIVTGDFVFAGDVGRPDLLERAAGFEGTMDRAARTLYASLQKFAAFPDWLQIWPGHGAGSACGKSLSGVPSSTVGYERRFNWAFQVADESAFVQQVLAGQPEPPRYFAEMKRINKAGPAPFPAIPATLTDLAQLKDAVARGMPLVDTRPAAAFAASHLPGSINIPFGASFNSWAGWFLPYDRDIAIILDPSCPTCGPDAVRELARVGLDRVTHVFDGAVLDEWRSEGLPMSRVTQIDASELEARGDDVTVIDVRGHAEWEAGHLPGVRNIPAGLLPDHIDELPRDRPVVLHCQGGTRSAIACSVLQSRGFTNVMNLKGGIAECQRQGLAVTSDAGEEAWAS